MIGGGGSGGSIMINSGMSVSAIGAGSMGVGGGVGIPLDNRPPPPPHSSLLHMAGNSEILFPFPVTSCCDWDGRSITNPPTRDVI